MAQEEGGEGREEIALLVIHPALSPSTSKTENPTQLGQFPAGWYKMDLLTHLLKTVPNTFKIPLV